MKGKKLFFALILALIVCIALVPLCAYADGEDAGTDIIEGAENGGNGGDTENGGSNTEQLPTYKVGEGGTVAETEVETNDGTKEIVETDTLQNAIDIAGNESSNISDGNSAQTVTPTDSVVYLTADTNECIVIRENQNVTLNIAKGVTLTNSTEGTGDKDTIRVLQGGTLTITGEGTIDNVSHGYSAIFNEGTVYLKGSVTVSRSAEASTKAGDAANNSYYVITNHGALLDISENATVMFSTSRNGYSSLIDNGYVHGSVSYRNYSSVELKALNEAAPKTYTATANNATNPKLVIRGGTLKGDTLTGGLITIKNDSNGILEIYGGVITQPATNQYAIFSYSEAYLYGGEINGDVGCNSYHPYWPVYADYTHDYGVITLDGATINGKVDVGYQFNMKSGTINGNVIVGKKYPYEAGHPYYLYDYLFNMTGGTVNGDIYTAFSGDNDTNYNTAEAKGAEIAISGGNVNGTISEKTSKSTVNVNGGIFTSDITKFNSGATVVTVGGKFYVGSAIEALDKTAQAVKVVAGDYEFTGAVAGFTVTNNGDGTVTVDGVAVLNGETYTVPEPVVEEPVVEPEEEPVEEVVEEPVVEESEPVVTTTVEAVVEGTSTVSLAANEDVVIKLNFTANDKSGETVEVTAVIINGVEVEFTISEDGSIVLSPEVLAALGPGTHVIYIRTSEGLVKVTITITE